jgi:hypothetical protein
MTGNPDTYVLASTLLNVANPSNSVRPIHIVSGDHNTREKDYSSSERSKSAAPTVKNGIGRRLFNSVVNALQPAPWQLVQPEE